jgi:hypothetical protein
VNVIVALWIPMIPVPSSWMKRKSARWPDPHYKPRNVLPVRTQTRCVPEQRVKTLFLNAIRWAAER